MGKLLEIENVHSYYGHIHALKGISMYVEEGEIVSLIGSNGAGKSTTLRTISGLIHPKQGSITLAGKDIAHLDPHLVVAEGVGHVPEGRGIFPKLTVRENLEMGAFRSKDVAKNNETMEQVFELFPRLKERVDQYGGTLSGGEQQMLAIGRGLMLYPRILMLDEPSMGLAPVLVEPPSCSWSRTHTWRSPLHIAGMYYKPARSCSPIQQINSRRMRWYKNHIWASNKE